MPSARWIKAVDHIKGRGQTGHDWIGDWLGRGEVQPGELIAAAFETFEPDRGVFDRVRLFGVLVANGGAATLVEWASADAPGWSRKLRMRARKYLGLDADGRRRFLLTLTSTTAPEVRRKYRLEDNDYDNH